MICTSWVNYGNEQLYEQNCQKQKLAKDQDLELNTTTKSILENKDNLKVNENLNSITNQTTTDQRIENQFIPQISVNNQSQNSITTTIKQDDQKYAIREYHINNRLWNSNAQLSNRSSFSNTSIKYQDTLNFVYSYIDIERLILDNLKERIKSLGECGLIGYSELFASDNSFDAKAFDKKIEQKMKDDLNKNNVCALDKNVDEQNSNIPNNDAKLDSNNSHHLVNESKDLNLHHNLKNSDALKSHLNEMNLNELNLKNDDNQMQLTTNHNQTHSLPKAKENKKHSKRKRSIRNNYWAAFLRACEEDFEFNQSKINTNYNSRKLRECMFTYANCITNNWVFSLIEKEIENRNESLKERFKKLISSDESCQCKKLSISEKLDENDEMCKENRLANSTVSNLTKEYDYILPETIYIINIVPNQINIFRHCLFLQQTPNLANFHINYIAINLISGDLRKKDLDSIISHSIQDELNFNYMNYFRSMHRLTDVQIRQLKQKIRIRITKGKQAIKMNSESDVQILFGALDSDQEIDLSNFKVQHDKKRSIKKSFDETEKGNLLFLLDDIVDIGDLLFIIEDRSLEMSKLRKFIQVYLHQKDKISFNRLYS